MTLYQRYLIYVECAKSSGEEIISFDEWLNR